MAEGVQQSMVMHTSKGIYEIQILYDGSIVVYLNKELIFKSTEEQ